MTLTQTMDVVIVLDYSLCFLLNSSNSGKLGRQPLGPRGKSLAAARAGSGKDGVVSLKPAQDTSRRRRGREPQLRYTPEQTPRHQYWRSFFYLIAKIDLL